MYLACNGFLVMRRHESRVFACLAVNCVIWMQVLGASVEMVMSIPTS